MNILRQVRTPLSILMIILLIAALGYYLLKNTPHAGSGNKTMCALTGMVVKGSDIFDGDTKIDWLQLRDTGVKFVFIKATQGKDFVNPLYAMQREQANQYQIKYASYHYFNPKDDPMLQVQLFLKTALPFDHKHLPPMLDWEETGNLPVSDQIANVKLWLKEVEKAGGIKPIIYISPAFFNQLGNPPDFKDYPLFIAHYDVSCPSIPPIWSNWMFWQKGSQTLYGIPGRKSDDDIFNGSEADLNNFIEQAWARWL